MKNAIVILLSVSVLAVALQDVFIYLSFKINQDYIAENLCIDKDKVESMCHGTCYLKDKISESKETEPNDPAPIPGENNLTLPDYSDYNPLTLIASNQIIGNILITDADLFHCDYMDKTFHPPKC